MFEAIKPLSVGARRLLSILLTGLMALTGLVALFQLAPAESARAAGALDVTIVAGYNLVVDSNVESPSTYAPSVATVMGRFCNTGDAPLTDVSGYIGSSAAGTPGSYPARDSSQPAFQAEHPHLANTGSYAFTHVGGRAGAGDATRYLGTLAAGECRNEYWHISYPRRANPDNSGVAIWGVTNDPNDDLWLSFDVWGDAAEGAADSASWTMTMRNEISANANKIAPNGSAWFNTDTSIVEPGAVITTNGIKYEIGVVNKGFDNDGDFAYDYNVWLQPVGDPAYDPSCFRLIRTSGVLTVSISAGPDQIIQFQDQLYFTNLPASNNGVTGNVYYTFIALDGPCFEGLTPYQEVASGADNEKFSGDYGYQTPGIAATEPRVTLDKQVSAASADPGDSLTYTIDFANDGSEAAGRPEYGVPLVVSDTIPAGTSYVAGSAVAANSFSWSAGVQVRFSTDGGASWSNSEPANPADVTTLQWWLDSSMPAGASATVSFQAQVDNPYSASPFIHNVADLRFGSGAPFDEDDALTLVNGNNSLGDFVWEDSDGDARVDGGESPLSGVGVSLYWDRNGDGLLDDGDVFVRSTASDAGGAYGFTFLPDGRFLAVVDADDADIPAGFHPTTATVIGADLDSAGATLTPVDFTTADFGFGPSLDLTKTLNSGSPFLEGSSVSYTVDVTNLVGGGSGTATSCTYDVWTNTYVSSNGWVDWLNAVSIDEPDGLFASTVFAGNADRLRTSTVDLSGISGNITAVEAIYSIYLSGSLADDTLTGNVYGTPSGDLSQLFSTADLNAGFVGAANQGIISFDVTGGGWTAADFTAVQMDLTAHKSANSDGVTAFIDAQGFRITVDQPCGGDDDVLSIVPVTDTYDPTQLQFVSADPAPDGVTPGTLTWDNLGPIVPGETKSITLSFIALPPADTDFDGEGDPALVVNNAAVSNAFFFDGDPANDDNDAAVGTLQPAGSIGDTIYNDNGAGGGTAGNGVQDGGEAGIAGVTVQLYQGAVLVATTTTDAAGSYLFSGLADATYTVVVDTASLPGSSFTQSGDPDATFDNQSTTTINNNDGNPANDDDLTRDFGYQVPNAIFGTVWEDNDGDGSREAGENGLAAVDVYLDDCGANAICGDGDDGATRSTTTAADGSYRFEDLPDGNYRVRVDDATLPAGVTWTQTADPDAALDDQSNVIAAAGGTVYGAYDFGYAPSGSSQVGDTLYRDWNGNGVQDSGEEGLANVTVWLYEDSNGDGAVDPALDALIATAVTDAAGNYLFSGLPAGNVIVVVDKTDPDFPVGHAQTQDPDEPAVCAVCNGRGSATLTGANAVMTVDFGYQPQGSGRIGDFVWQDDDGDGVQDGAESGLANVTVTLYEDSNGSGAIDAGDAVVAITATAADGSYQFSRLAAGSYLVAVDSGDADLPTDGAGGTYVPSTPTVDVVALAAGQVYAEADFGFTAGGTIGDFVWQDNDGDGNQEAGEPGLADILVSLYTDTDADGTPDTLVDTVSTAADGSYQFSSLPAGRYVVVVDAADADLPNGSTLTGDPDESATCVTCDGQTVVNLNAGQTFVAADFGFKPGAVVGDFVWYDLNGDGVQDAGEPGIGGVVVTLTLQGGTVITTTTDGDGAYTFGNVPDGSHVVSVDGATLPAGMAQSYDPDQSGTCTSCDGQGAAPISGAVSDLTLDFGYELSGSYAISGTVFDDIDQSGGDVEAGEPGISDVTVYLWQDSNGDGVGDRLVASTTSGFNGEYSFSGLPAGSYTVSTESGAPTLVGMTTTTTGNQNDGAGYEHATISSADVTGVDFGFYSPDIPTALAGARFAAPPAAGLAWSGLLLLLALFGSLALLRRRV